MFKKYFENELSALNKNMLANFKALFEPVKIDLPAILDYFWMIAKAIIIVFGLVTVIGIVQKPGKDANVQYTLSANHEEMLGDEVE